MDQAAALLPAGDAANPMERLLGTALRLPRMLREGAGTVEITAIVDALPSSAALSGGLVGYHLSQAVRAMAATASVTAAYNHGSPAERAAASAAFVHAVDAVSGGKLLRGNLLVIAVNLALDLLDRHPDPALDEAARRWVAESVARCAHPSDQSWAPAWFNLARLHRRSGGRDDLARGRAHALSALRGRTWQIVLQYDADYGLEAARRRPATSGGGPVVPRRRRGGSPCRPAADPRRPGPGARRRPRHGSRRRRGGRGRPRRARRPGRAGARRAVAGPASGSTTPIRSSTSPTCDTGW